MDKPLSLAEINEALKPYQREKELKTDWEAEREDLEVILGSLRYALTVLDEHVDKEWADVEAVKEPGWKSFWYGLTGEQDRKLEKEMADWETARGERQKLIKEIEKVEKERQEIEHQLQSVKDIELPLNELLKLKAAQLLKAPPHPRYNQLVKEYRKIKTAREKLIVIYHTAGPAFRSLDQLYNQVRGHHRPGQATQSQQKLYHYLVSITQPQLKTLGLHLQGTKKMLQLPLSFPIREVSRFSIHFKVAKTPTQKTEVVAKYRRYCQELKEVSLERDKHFLNLRNQNQQARTALLWTLS
ncbi:MAG: hypothetical protein AAFN10_03950 [Bacteroidota bacterium]